MLLNTVDRTVITVVSIVNWSSAVVSVTRIVNVPDVRASTRNRNVVLCGGSIEDLLGAVGERQLACSRGAP